MEQKKKRVAEYLYNNSVNTSNNKQTYPSGYSDIEKVILNISIDVNTAYNQITVRTKFVGSGRYFTMGIDEDKLSYWINIIKMFVIRKPELNLLMDIPQEEEEVSDVDIVSNPTLIEHNDDNLCQICMSKECEC